MSSKDIVVGLDGSPRTEAVLRAALELAGATDARLVVVHVVQLPPELPASLWGANPEEMIGQVLRGARRQVDGWLRGVPARRLHDVIVELGVPWRQLCEIATARDASAIVVGAHGHGALERIVGTTASRVVNHADRPVLVVRPKE
jgi:nucleotide-binding universal stress UspA family protein